MRPVLGKGDALLCNFDVSPRLIGRDSVTQAVERLNECPLPLRVKGVDLASRVKIWGKYIVGEQISQDGVFRLFLPLRL